MVLLRLTTAVAIAVAGMGGAFHSRSGAPRGRRWLPKRLPGERPQLPRARRYLDDVGGAQSGVSTRKDEVEDVRDEPPTERPRPFDQPSTGPHSALPGPPSA